MQCDFCSKVFQTRSGYRKHMKRHHPDEARKKKKIYICRKCHASFSRLVDKMKHIKTEHSTEKYLRCHECGTTFDRMANLRSHLADRHDYNMDKLEVQFESEQEFQTWKMQLEKDTKTFYTKRYGKKIDTEIYYCHRSGYYKAPDSRKRQIKSQGTCKLGSYCTSAIKFDANSVKATFWPTHYGHVFDERHIGHLRLSSLDKLNIQNKLIAGVTFHRILQDFIANMVQKEDFGQPILTRKDLHNISRNIVRKTGVPEANDSMDTEMLVTNFRDTGEATLLLYKRQGDFHPVLAAESFALGFWTPYQKQKFLELGCNLVCMDSTHDTNAFDFELITLMVMEKNGTWLPVAWLISNLQNYNVLELFLLALKEDATNEGEVPRPRFFMSDKAPQFYGAWTHVMGVGPKKLLCSWHVLKDLKRKLSLIEDRDMKSTVFENLCTIMMETDDQVAKLAAQQLTAKLCQHAKTANFGSYFQNEWMGCLSEWAALGRVGAVVNTNMFLEPFHRALKYEYLNGRKDRRLDKLLASLMEYSRNMMMTNLRRSMKNYKSAKQTAISLDHEKSVELNPDSVHQTHDGWVVESSSYDLQYRIERINDTCPHPEACGLTCEKCRICCHEYKCSCFAAHGASLICKHIHLVAINEKRQSPAFEIALHTEVGPGFNSIERPTETEQKAIHTKVISKAAHVSQLIAENIEQLSYTSQLEIQKKLEDLDLFMKTAIDSENTNAVITEVFDPGQSTPVQPRKTFLERQQFHSTRKQTPTCQIVITPTPEESQTILAESTGLEDNEDPTGQINQDHTYMKLTW